jgi:hypothetical protein
VSDTDSQAPDPTATEEVFIHIPEPDGGIEIPDDDLEKGAFIGPDFGEQAAEIEMEGDLDADRGKTRPPPK